MSDKKDKNKKILLIIDPQKDFHDSQLIKADYPYEATLPVAGSTANAVEIAKMIKDNVTEIDEIFITLDTHHANHIGHASFWTNKNPDKYKKFIDRDEVNIDGTRTYSGWCLDYINNIQKKLDSGKTVSNKEMEKKIVYGLLIEGEKTKNQKIEIMQCRIDGKDKDSKALEDKFVQIPTKKMWLDDLNKKVQGATDSENKNIYLKEIEKIKEERKAPDAFANIYCEMVREEVWVPKDDSLYDYAIYYTSQLESKGKFVHTIWPPHCLTGTEGHAVEDNISKACNYWTEVTLRPVTYVYKGMNLLTENFSAIEAEVPLSSDPTTQKNIKLLESLRKDCQYLIVVGQARSHCVRYTVEHIVDDWMKHVWNKEKKMQIILPENGSSCVAPPDVPSLYIEGTKAFIIEMKKLSKGNCVCDQGTDENGNKKVLNCVDVFEYIK